MAFVAVCATDPGVGASCPPASLAWVDLQAVVAPDQLGVTSAQVASVFGWGFAAVILLWWFGYVIGVALMAIRKV